VVLLNLTELEKSAEGMSDGGLNPGGGKRFTLNTGPAALLVSSTLTLKVCLIGSQLSTSMCLFCRDILCHFHIKLEETLLPTNLDNWRTCILFQKDGSV